MNEENNEIKKIQEEHKRAMEKNAYNAMVNAGNDYIRTHGEENVRKDFDIIKANLSAWNMITGSTMRFSLNTLDILLAAFATFPMIVDPKIAVMPSYYQHYCKLSAMRNIMLADIRKKAETALEISTLNQQPRNDNDGNVVI